jgi:hypothetical protein
MCQDSQGQFWCNPKATFNPDLPGNGVCVRRNAPG